MVKLVSVAQDPDAALTNNKVLAEQGGSPLTSLLLLAAKNNEEEEGENCFVSTDNFTMLCIHTMCWPFSYTIHTWSPSSLYRMYPHLSDII
jgi:hypothetical protein